MCSSVFRLSRLSRHFCTQTSTTTPPTTTTKSHLHNHDKQKTLTKLVENFKHLSSNPRFRKHHTIYETTITRLIQAKKPSLIQDLLEHQKNYSYDMKKEGFVLRLISLYGKACMPDHAHKLFDEMPERECTRTVKSLNALLQAYVQAKKYDDVLKLFRELPLSASIQPNDWTYTVVVQALCEKGDLVSAEIMLDEMESYWMKPNVFTFNILMHGFYSNGRFKDGDRVWARMEESGVEPDLVSFNGKLNCLLPKGEITDAVKLLEEMMRRELKPNIITFNILVKWYCNAGHLDEAKGVYDRLKENDCVPNRVTYQALIRCSCVEENLDFALELCKESVNGKCYIDIAILRNVVNLLVKDSRVEEAEELLELAYSINYNRSKLKMPATRE